MAKKLSPDARWQKQMRKREIKEEAAIQKMLNTMTGRDRPEYNVFIVKEKSL